MDAQLRKLVEYAEPKPKSFICVSGNKSRLKTPLEFLPSWMDIHIPTGCYEIKAINNEFQRFIMKRKMKTNNSSNPNTLRCVLQILHEKCRVDFNVDDSLCKVLGFNKKIYKAGRHESENLVNILSVNSILVHCDVIDASRLNGIEAPLIYSFFPDVAPGDRIVCTPLHLIYIPLTMNIISHMTCWLTDQNGK